METRVNEHNIGNSIALYLAGKLLTEGYVLYWHQIDAVQTPDQWYPQYSINQSTYLVDATFAARIAAAKGLLTILPKKSAIPRWVQRPTNDGRVQPQESVPIPALSVTIGPMATIENYELGSTLKWRGRRLQIDGYARSTTEQSRLVDLLGAWLDQELMLDVLDHETGDLAPVGTVEVCHVSLDTGFDFDEAEATTYEVLFNARLEYVV